MTPNSSQAATQDSYDQLRQRVLVEHSLTLLVVIAVVIAGIAAISPQVLAYTAWIPNLSQRADRPDLPDRGMPTDRRSAGMRNLCFQTGISFASQESAQPPWTPNSSQRVDRPHPPDRGIPTERKHADNWVSCAAMERPLTSLKD